MTESFSPIVNKFRVAITLYAVLSMTDLLLTGFSMTFLGAIEVNPIMSFFFSINIFSAALFKVAIILMVGMVCNNLWHHQEVRFILAFGNFLMMVIVAYQLAGILGTVSAYV